MDMKYAKHLLAPLALIMGLACGGGSNDHIAKTDTLKLATKLTYTNPAAAPAGWSLVKDATSTNTHLVLNLVGPSDGTKYRGVGFTIQLDQTSVKFAKFLDADGKSLGYYQDGGVFLDKDATGTDQPVVLQAGGVSGNKLTVGIFQRKDDNFFGATGIDSTPARDCGSPVLKIAMDLDTTGGWTPATVPFKVVKSRTVVERINHAQRLMTGIQVNVGTLALE
jgi:hypothetical protein